MIFATDIRLAQAGFLLLSNSHIISDQYLLEERWCKDLIWVVWAAGVSVALTGMDFCASCWCRLAWVTIVYSNLPRSDQGIFLWARNLSCFPSKLELLACWPGSVKLHFIVIVREFTGRTSSLLMCLMVICSLGGKGHLVSFQRKVKNSTTLYLDGSTSLSVLRGAFFLSPPLSASLPDSSFLFQSAARHAATLPSRLEASGLPLTYSWLAFSDLCILTSQRTQRSSYFYHVFLLCYQPLH